jgi:hypothetical protein
MSVAKMSVLLGFGLGLLLYSSADLILASDSVDDYPGLEERLTEEQDECEARPGIVECVWNKDKATYTPKGRYDR